VDRIEGGNVPRVLLKIAQQAFAVVEPMRPWRAVQGWALFEIMREKAFKSDVRFDP
jgi:hypothetical protein